MKFINWDQSYLIIEVTVFKLNYNQRFLRLFNQMERNNMGYQNLVKKNLGPPMYTSDKNINHVIKGAN